MDISERLTSKEALKHVLEDGYNAAYPNLSILSAYRINNGYMVLANPRGTMREALSLYFFDEWGTNLVRTSFPSSFTIHAIKEQTADIARAIGGILCHYSHGFRDR